MINQFSKSKKNVEKLMEILISNIEKENDKSRKIYAVKNYTNIIENMIMGDEFHSLLDNIDVRGMNYDVDDVWNAILKPLTFRNGEKITEKENIIIDSIENAISFIEKMDKFFEH